MAKIAQGGLQHIHADGSMTEQQVLEKATLSARVDLNRCCIDIVEIARDCHCRRMFVNERTYLVVIQYYSPPERQTVM